MQSLGDTLRRLPAMPNVDSAERLAEQVLNDPLVLKFRQRHPDLDDHTLRASLNRLYQMSKEYRNCKACPGLTKCPNDMQGHSTGLICTPVGDRLQIVDQKTPCQKFLAHEQQQQINRNITSFHVDETVIGLQYDEAEMIKIDPGRALAVSQLQQYVNATINDGLMKKGLYLQGDFGTGKTYLAGYLLQRLAREGYTGVIVYMPEFVEDAKALMLEPQKLKETVTLMKDADLLIFDDIGAENLSPWVRDHVLGSILNFRMNRKPTFYTSNHDLDALEKHFSFTHKEGEEMHKGQRLMDRVRPFVEVVHVRGRNHRG